MAMSAMMPHRNGDVLVAEPFHQAAHPPASARSTCNLLLVAVPVYRSPFTLTLFRPGTPPAPPPPPA